MGRVVAFDKQKIYNAIMKAMSYGSGIIDEDSAAIIADEIELQAANRIDDITIREIEKCRL